MILNKPGVLIHLEGEVAEPPRAQRLIERLSLESLAWLAAEPPAVGSGSQISADATWAEGSGPGVQAGNGAAVKCI